MPNSHQTQTAVTIEAAAEIHLLDCAVRGLSPRTIENYQEQNLVLVRGLGPLGIATLQEITPLAIRQHMAEMQRRDLSKAYVATQARYIRLFLRFCHAEGLIDSNPSDKVRLPRAPRNVLGALTAEEIARVLKACTQERDRAIIYFLLDSGLRASELTALNAEDVNQDGRVSVWSGKGDKDRIAFIGKRTQKAVRRYFLLERGGVPDDHEPLFLAQGGYRMAYRTLADMLRRTGRRAGVEFTAHTLRRTFALQSMRNGMSIYVLARLMGHVDITTLRHYLPLVEDDLSGAAARAGVVDNLT